MNTKRINDNILMITLSGIDSNIYLIEDKNAIVDTGTGLNFTRLYDIFKKLNKQFDDIKTIINTHMHFDHIGGNGYFSNAKIAIHRIEASVLENGDKTMVNAEFFNGKMHPMKVAVKLEEGDIIEGLKVIHTPGHSPGSICLMEPKERILFTGDTIFSDGVGRTDWPGGNENKLTESIEKISKMDVQGILPGHGEPVLENTKKIFDIIKGNV